MSEKRWVRIELEFEGSFNIEDVYLELYEVLDNGWLEYIIVDENGAEIEE